MCLIADSMAKLRMDDSMDYPTLMQVYLRKR